MKERMKIGFSATDKTLDAPIDPRFGRCHYFLIFDTDTNAYEAIENIQQRASGGAGIQAAELMAKKQVSVVITGNVGPNAFQTLTAANIKVITGLQGNIKEVLDKYKNGELQNTKQPTVHSHYGMG